MTILASTDLVQTDRRDTNGVGVAGVASMAELMTSLALLGLFGNPVAAQGAGGAVTQITSRVTGVTLNKASGAITLFNAAGSATPFSFTLTNSLITANDTISFAQQTGADKYRVDVTNVGNGTAQITITDLTGTTAEAPVFNFNLIKGCNS